MDAYTRRKKILAATAVIIGLGGDAVIVSWYGALGPALLFVLIYAWMAWLLSGFIWPARQDRSEIIRPRWKL